MWTRRRVLELFHMRHGVVVNDGVIWDERWDVFADLANQGLIDMVEEIYEPIPVPEDGPLVDAWNGSAKGQQSHAHRLLKWYAWNWMSNIGAHKPTYERKILYGYPDVSSWKSRVFVECGVTDVIKFFSLVRRYRTFRFVLYPFPIDGVHERVIITATKKTRQRYEEETERRREESRLETERRFAAYYASISTGTA